MFLRQRFLTQPPIESPSCQLLTGLNALRLHGVRTPSPGDQAFEDLLDLANCRENGAEHIVPIWRQLGLLVETGPASFEWIVKRVSYGFPVAVVTDIKPGEAHMGLAVKVTSEGIHIVNWKAHETVTKIMYGNLLLEGLRDYAYALSYPGYSEVW